MKLVRSLVARYQMDVTFATVPNTNAHLRFIDYFTRPGATKQQILEKLQKVKFSPENCDRVPILDLMGMGAVPVQTLFELVDKFQVCVRNVSPGNVQQLWKSSGEELLR